MNAPEPYRPSDSEVTASNAANTSADKQRAIVLHELLRVRRQAEAARLEAKASRLDASAEQLQSLLNRIDAGESIPAGKLVEFGIDDDAMLGNVSTSGQHNDASPPSPPASPAHESTDHSPTRFNSWEAVRDAQQKLASTFRFDSAHRTVKRPRMFVQTDNEENDTTPDAIATDERLNPAIAAETGQPVTAPDRTSKQPADPADNVEPDDIDSGDTVARESDADTPEQDFLFSETSGQPLPLTEVLLDDQEDALPRRRQSVAFIVSAAVHAIILICLAGFTLTSVMPKDQVALSASVSEVSDQAMETFQIETVQPAEDPSETTPDETQYDLDPMGEMAVVEVTPGVTSVSTAPPLSTRAFRQPTSASTASLKSLKSDSKSKMQFCGVEGGGNHFAYLVDSSGSMGDAFISARRALIESIGMLNQEQRFYVIFFDAKCDYMRITRADQNEARSVYATAENKQRLKSWAMRVEMDRGKAPYEPLTYALQKLKPDVIFLLSDGEFPQGIEDLLQEENRVTNLFGETNPVSIIHTISYYSREGESRMRRIAENNFGQYRHVPKP